MFLIPHVTDGDEAARLQPLELALHGSASGRRFDEYLAGEEGTIGVTEEDAENPLLCSRQESVRDRGATPSTHFG